REPRPRDQDETEPRCGHLGRAGDVRTRHHGCRRDPVDPAGGADERHRSGAPWRGADLHHFHRALTSRNHTRGCRSHPCGDEIMRRWSCWLAMAGIAASLATPGVAWSSVPPPRPFAPEAITGGTGVDCLTFTPDGGTALLDIEGSHSSTIAISRRTADGWSLPRTASFSGRWVDHDPAVAPDGSYLIFTSNRPDTAGGPALHGGHLWRVDRSAKGWSVPTRLPDEVNFGPNIYAPGIAANGDLFFLSKDNPSHDFHLYRAAWRSGHYLEPVQLHLGPADGHELDPAIAPDESFIVFDANYAGRNEPDHLYIAFADGDHWSNPIDLGDTLDRLQPWGSHLGSDGHTLYFTSDAPLVPGGKRANHIWSVDLASRLHAQRGDGEAMARVFAPGVISG